MEKLELKHLAGYLPYGLKGNYEISAVVPSAKYQIRNKELRIDNIYFFLEYAKPILRPLSDLTKEIEVNGEKFVPIEIIDNRNNLSVLEILNDNDLIDCLPYWVIRYLYEWHFDINGLIEKDLAIDINTLK